MGTCPREWKQSPVLGRKWQNKEKVFNAQHARVLLPIDMPWRKERKEKGGMELGGRGGGA